MRQWNFFASAGGATAVSTGDISYLVSPCQVAAHGVFHEASTGGNEHGSATTGLDQTLQIGVRVSQFTPYALTGFVSATGTSKDAAASPTDFFVTCTSHQVVMGHIDLRNPTGFMPFEEHSSLYPEDLLYLLCSLHRGGASTDATGDDEGDLEWSITLNLGVE